MHILINDKMFLQMYTSFKINYDKIVEEVKYT